MWQETLSQMNDEQPPLSQLPKIYSIAIDPETLAHYSRELNLADSTEALSTLAQTIAGQMPGTVLIARSTPQPALAVLGCFDAAEVMRIRHLLSTLNTDITRLRYVSYRQAELDSQLLAMQLVEHFGYEELKKFHFTAIPRGGLIVLGMLAYALDLTPNQLQPPPSTDVPWVVVDDCVFTGSRLSHFLQCHSQQTVVFAHLYSHSELRRAIASREQNVLACLSARNIYDYAPQDLGDNYSTWQTQSLAQLPGLRYWVGKTEHICFTWNEPDRFFWNPVSEKVEACWQLLPKEICFKNYRKFPANSLAIQIQPDGKGIIQPGWQVIFGEYEEQILLSNLETQENFSLTGVAADIWKALVEYDNPEQVVTKLLKSYEVDETILKSDVNTFVDQLCAQGLLINTSTAK